LPTGFEHVHVDKDVVARNIGEIGSNVADPPHICGEIVDLVNDSGCLLAVAELSQIQNLKLVSRAGLVFRVLNVYSSYPESICLEALNQMVPYKTPGSGHKYSLLTHGDFSSDQRCWLELKTVAGFLFGRTVRGDEQSG
jgi:hypothetical protein